jgi:hypothetical protein
MRWFPIQKIEDGVFIVGILRFIGCPLCLVSELAVEHDVKQRAVDLQSAL